MNLFLAPQSLALWWPDFERWDDRRRAEQTEETHRKISQAVADTPNEAGEAGITCGEVAQERPAP